MLTMTGRIVNSDTQQPGAVRKWSEGGIPSRTRAHSRTNHFTQAQLIPHPPFPASPRLQPHLHAPALARTHARFPHAGYCTPSSQPCKERLQQELLVIVHSTRRGPKDTSSALSTSVPPCVMSCSKGLQDTCSALYAYSYGVCQAARKGSKKSFSALLSYIVLL